MTGSQAAAGGLDSSLEFKSNTWGAAVTGSVCVSVAPQRNPLKAINHVTTAFQGCSSACVTIFLIIAGTTHTQAPPPSTRSIWIRDVYIMSG